jgi:N4-gp56 family major capsid protein
MATTNFTRLTTEQKAVWSRDLWRQARNLSFLNQFSGTDSNAMLQRVTELTKTEKGDRAIITLVAELQEDGIAGDATLEGNEEAIDAFDQVVRIDQLRHANRSEGRMAEQKTVVRFRETSRDMLAYWLSDRMDQMGILTLSGVAYTFTNRGATRTGSDLPNLDFAADVTAPSAARHLRWDSTVPGLVAGNTAAVIAADLPTYEMLLRLKAYAKENYVRPIRMQGGIEMYHVFMTPTGMSHLKLDADYLANVRNALPRSQKNPLFAGTSSVELDGMMIHEHRHVFNTEGAVSGTGKWGAGSNIDGQRVLFCGAQALAMADIGLPTWVEKEFDYDNQPGISTGKIFGMKKPVFPDVLTGANEDFGVIACDTSQ